MRFARTSLPGGGTALACSRGDGWSLLGHDDLIGALAGGAALEAVAELPGGPVGSHLPFAPRSLRAFSLSAEHMERSARVLVQRFFPAPARRIVSGYERVTGRTFPRLRPPIGFYERPAFYMGNHTAFSADGDDIAWPSHTRWLDFELELGFVLAREVRDADPAEGEAAIGAFVLLNDWSARDQQARDARHGVFGNAVKAKTFANSMGTIAVTADELLPQLGALEAQVRVNGEVWAHGTTAGAQFSPGEMVAWASAGETLGPGDLFACGTVPGCCGLELDRWLSPGDVVELALDGVGTLRNRVTDKEEPCRKD